MEAKDRGARCPHCGAHVREEARRCSTCLRSLTSALPPAEAPTGVGPATARPPAQARTTLEPGQHFGTRYHILKLLGTGGMGAVYQAWDAELGVAVALKMIRPDVGTDPAGAKDLERRFKQELLLARQVTHKNVVRIHDLGEIDGLKYITMPFIEGSDLSTILRQTGKLPVTTAMHMARQIAAGLQAAHEAGIVHRDLKPANIMVEQDHALITDFGIARSAARPAPATGVGAKPGGLADAGTLPDDETRAAATVAGAVVGTVDYMAPEQAKAEPVDQRADIYAFGLIFYDMLLGLRQARRTENAIEELSRRLKEAPPSPRSIDPEIPEPLDQVVMRCLQPDPAARFQTTGELVAALDRLDDHGKLLPLVRRLTPRLMVATALLVIAMVVGTYLLAMRMMAPPVQHDPVSVVIADFANRTDDPTFDGTLAPVLRLALEGAGFISAYDRTAIRNLGVRPVEKLDEQAALELAVKQGVNVVLSGFLERQGSRYAVSVRAVQTVTGQEITTQTQRASSKAEVLGVVADLGTAVREALGDETTSDAARRFALETLSATSLDAVHEYARGLEDLSASRFEDALQKFSRAVELDPTFGGAYGGMAIAAYNLDRRQDAEEHLKAALGHLDSMTERERYRTRGFYYLITDDYPACVKEYGDLIARYPADASARNNRSMCLSYLRDIPAALEEMRQAVRILPNRTLYQQNLAEYLVNSSDFPAAEQQARSIKEPGLFALLALASAQVGQGRVSDAEETFRELSKADEQGASYAASGLAAIATYEGRFSDAGRLLRQGADADVASKDTDRAADKFVALAHVELLRGRQAEAIAAADEALANSQSVKIRFLAGRVFVEAGAAEKAVAASKELASALQAASQAYGKILNGLMALRARDVRRAVQELTEANTLLDTWIGHYDLGRTYLEAGAFLQADSEFERCYNRRGEALSLFLDNEPTYGYFPPVYYYQGRVRDGLKSTRAGESYQAYLGIRGGSTEDPLVPEVRRRAAPAR